MPSAEPVTIMIPRKVYTQLMEYSRNCHTDMRKIVCQMIGEGLQNPACLSPRHSVADENKAVAAFSIWIPSELTKSLKNIIEALPGRTLDRVITRYIEEGLELRTRPKAELPVLPAPMRELLDNHYAYLALIAASKAAC